MPVPSAEAIETLARRAAADPAIRALAMNVTGGAEWTNQYAAATALLKYVQARVRYRLDPDGWDVYQDHTMTLQQGSGDCAAQTILLLGLLRSIGIESYAVYLDAGAGVAHVFVIAYPVNGQPFYLDPIAYHLSPGQSMSGQLYEYRAE